jgi:hypothetical protein
MTVRRGKIKRTRSAGSVKPASFKGTPCKIQRYGWVPDLPDATGYTIRWVGRSPSAASASGWASGNGL